MGPGVRRDDTVRVSPTIAHFIFAIACSAAM